MGQEDEGGLTQEQARLLWQDDPEDVFRRFRDDAITLIEICAAVHCEATCANASTELKLVFEPWRDTLTSARCSAKNLWWSTPLTDFLSRSKPVFVVSRGDHRSRLDGSCFHEVAINIADCLLVAADSKTTVEQFASYLRFQTGRGDFVTDYLRSLVADIRCESREGLERFRLGRDRGVPSTKNALTSHGNPSPAQESGDTAVGPPAAEPQRQVKHFTGGTLEFLADSVKLCGIGICSGGRPKRMREVLESLRQTRADGSYLSFSSSKLGEVIGIPGKSVAGCIRDLRDHISKVLSRSGIDCGRFDVILGGDRGYRLSENLSVHEVAAPIGPTGSDDRAAAIDPVGPDDPGRDPSRAPDDPGGEPGDTDDLKSTAGDRQAWILNQIDSGRELHVSDIAAGLEVSKATVKRDLKALRSQGKIHFVGTTRKGSYELGDGGSVAYRS